MINVYTGLLKWYELRDHVIVAVDEKKRLTLNFFQLLRSEAQRQVSFTKLNKHCTMCISHHQMRLVSSVALIKVSDGIQSEWKKNETCKTDHYHFKCDLLAECIWCDLKISPAHALIRMIFISSRCFDIKLSGPSLKYKFSQTQFAMRNLFACNLFILAIKDRKVW